MLILISVILWEERKENICFIRNSHSEETLSAEVSRNDMGIAKNNDVQMLLNFNPNNDGVKM